MLMLAAGGSNRAGSAVLRTVLGSRVGAARKQFREMAIEKEDMKKEEAEALFSLPKLYAEGMSNVSSPAICLYVRCVDLF